MPVNSSILTDEEKSSIKYLISFRSKIEDVEIIFPPVEDLRLNLGMEKAEKYEERTYYIWQKYEEILQDICKILLEPETRSNIPELLDDTMRLEVDYCSIVIDYLIYSIKTMIDDKFSTKELYAKYKTIEDKYLKTIRQMKKEFQEDCHNEIRVILDNFHKLFFEFEGLKMDLIRERSEKKYELIKWAIGALIPTVGVVIALIALFS